MSNLRKAHAHKEVEKAVKKLDSGEVKELAQEIIKAGEEIEKEEEKGRVPGKTIKGYKVGYTYADLCKIFPIVSFTPEETVPLTWNGVTVQALEGIEMHVPQCYKTLYDNHRQALRLAGKSLPNREFENMIALGAGGLEPEK